MTNVLVCDKCLDALLALDKGERLPLGLTLHLASCAKCRNTARLLAEAQRSLKAARARRARSVPLDMAKLLARVKALSYYIERHESPISLRRWVLSGLVMLIFLLSFTLVTHRLADSRLTLIFYLVFALIISTYGALFIGCNMDFFTKKFDLSLKA